MGYVDPKLAVIKYPERDQSVPAHYAVMRSEFSGWSRSKLSFE